MSIFDELIYDFELKRSRVLVSSNLAIIDNVQKLVLVSENSIVVSNGKEFTSITGSNLLIKELGEERMRIKGTIEKVEIYKNGNDKSAKGEGQNG